MYLENNKSRIKLWYHVPRLVANLDSMTRYAANFWDSKRHAKTICHPTVVFNTHHGKS